jgi:peptidoglycan/xylan/chitin deacetylase (PgdA/CDA1 family)
MEFGTIMDNILGDYNVNINSISKLLWMNNRDLETLNSNDQIIGLHSFTHPTNMPQLYFNTQYQEYIQNKEHIVSVTSKETIAVSHPCGSYDNSTLEILNQLGVQIGVRSNFHKLNHNPLEFPRVDHSDILLALN